MQQHILGLIEEQLKINSDLDAVILGVHVWTYGELDAFSCRIANGLGFGVKHERETVVAICLPRCPELVGALLGCIKAGVAWLPLDAKWPLSRIRVICETAGVNTVITNNSNRYIIHNAHAEADIIEVDGQQLSTQSSVFSNAPLHPSGAANVLFTSGSTGKPKGVVNTHAGLFNRLQWMQSTYKLHPGERVLQKTPYTFDVSVWEFIWPLMFGGCIVLARPDGHTDMRYLQSLIRGANISVLHFVPSVLDVFLQHIPKEYEWSVRQVICSGEALSSHTVKLFERQFPGTLLANLYGPTEAAIDVSAHDCQGGQEPVPIGKAIDNIFLHIVDQNYQPVEQGVLGELLIEGIGLARGYFNQPDLTAAAFTPYAFAETIGARVYRTGDLAIVNENNDIEFLGRLDHQVKINGVRIELGEIEHHLVQDEIVKAAVVTAQRTLTGRLTLVAHLVLVQEQPHADFVDSICSALRKTLPASSVPSHFMIIEALPLNTNGKLDRKALPQINWKGSGKALFGSSSEPVNDENRPDGKLERLLLKILCSVLGRDDIGVMDDFIRLGGDSIGIAQMQMLIHEAGYMANSEDIHIGRNVRGIAARIKTINDKPHLIDEVMPTASSTEYFSKGERARLQMLASKRGQSLQKIVLCADFVAGMLSESLQNPRSGFNFELVCMTMKSVDIQRLRKAWREVIRQHEVLRCSFSIIIPGKTAMLVFEDAEPDWQIFDWSKLDKQEQCTREQYLIDQFWREGLPLDALPLMRFVMIKLNNKGSWRCLWQLHHALTDGWSYQVILDAVRRNYQEREGEPKAFTLSYSDYQTWFLKKCKSQSVRDYWQEYLKPISQPARVSKLPSTQVIAPAFVESTWSMSLTADLKRIASCFDVTSASCIQLLWALLLSVAGKEKEVLYGVLYSARPPLAGMTGVAGPLFSLLPHYLCLEEDEPLEKIAVAIHRRQRLHSSNAWFEPNLLRDLLGSFSDERLFESVIVYENTPLHDSGDLFSDIQYQSRTNQSLVLFVWPGKTMRLELQYDTNQFDNVQAQVLLDTLRSGLEYMIGFEHSASDLTIADIVSAAIKPVFGAFMAPSESSEGNEVDVDLVI